GVYNSSSGALGLTGYSCKSTVGSQIRYSRSLSLFRGKGGAIQMELDFTSQSKRRVPIRREFACACAKDEPPTAQIPLNLRHPRPSRSSRRKTQILRRDSG